MDVAGGRSEIFPSPDEYVGTGEKNAGTDLARYEGGFEDEGRFVFVERNWGRQEKAVNANGYGRGQQGGNDAPPSGRMSPRKVEAPEFSRVGIEFHAERLDADDVAPSNQDARTFQVGHRWNEWP